MEYSVIMSGFGGQGVLMMGEFLAHCGMKTGLNVTWMPSYGVEMRGGTANCTVILSEDSIGAPITGSPKAVIAMSEPALNKFSPKLQQDGLLLVNSSLISCELPDSGNGLSRINVPTVDLARASGDEKMANIVMLGAFIASSKLFDPAVAAEEIESFLPPHKSGLALGINKALLKGQDYINNGSCA